MVMTADKSFMDKSKSIGPDIEPWRTPKMFVGRNTFFPVF